MLRSAELSSRQTTDVVVLVLENHQGEYLITQRSGDKHLGGYWEFPGGKIEAGESRTAALSRELTEELNYQPVSPKPLLTIHHSYPEKDVRLFVYHETADHPQVTAMEQQAHRWVRSKELPHIQLPEANQAIIDILCT